MKEGKKKRQKKNMRIASDSMSSRECELELYCWRTRFGPKYNHLETWMSEDPQTAVRHQLKSPDSVPNSTARHRD